MRCGVILLVLAGLLLVGCFRSSGSDTGDAGTLVSDGGVSDGDPSAPCGRIGGHEICGDETCPGFECPSVRSTCSRILGVCKDPGAWNPEPGSNGCWNSARDGEGEVATYCPNGQLCASIDTPPDDLADYFRGSGCVDVAYCEQVRDEGADVQCWYSDTTPFVDGPPLECPEDVHRVSTFCGPSCGGCEWYDSRPLAENGCIGVNEERGYGVCAFAANSTCVSSSSNAELTLFPPDGELGAAVCMLQLVDGVVPEFGHKVFIDACRAYRDRFPDSIDCVDGLWNTVE